LPPRSGGRKETTMSARRVRVPVTFPRERVVLGELHLLRRRLDGVLDEIGTVLRQPEVDEEAWPRVEEAARLARRALLAAVGAVPPLPAVAAVPELLRVGELRVDPAAGRQWYGAAGYQASDWVASLIEEAALFPNGKNDDQVDAFSQAINYARTHNPAPMRILQPTGRIPDNLEALGLRDKLSTGAFSGRHPIARRQARNLEELANILNIPYTDTTRE
jgi:hypothetical protein